MKEIEIGDVLEIRNEHKAHIDIITKKMNNARAILRAGGEDLQNAEKEMWKFIHETIPESKGFNMHLNHEKHIINITGTL